MNLVPYRKNSGIQDVNDVFDRMRQMMNIFDINQSVAGWDQSVTTLALDVRETDNDVIIETAVPGIKADDIELKITGRMLTINAETRYEAEEGDEDSSWHRRELHYGKVARSIELPVDVLADDVIAELENGMLTITLPKTDANPVHKIAVKARKLLK